MAHLEAPAGHVLPRLLKKFVDWFERQEGSSFRGFEIEIGTPYWNDASADRLKRDGFSFILTGDDSHLILLNTGKQSPPAVCLLGSEGATATIANSLEEFLELLAAGETGVMDLDASEASGRKKLKAWLSRNKVKAPPSAGFDFDAYLDGKSGAIVKTAPIKTKAEPIPEAVAKLPPILRQVVRIVGRRVDDPEVIKFITGTLGKKLPTSTTGVGGNKHVVDKKRGLEFSIDHDIINENYPLISKSKNSYLPYVALVWLNKNIKEVLPFGLTFGMSEKELSGLLGLPTGGTKAGGIPYWVRVIDPGREVVLRIEEDRYQIKIAEAREIRPYTYGGTERPATGALVAWAILRNLLDEQKLSDHAELIKVIRQRRQQGSALVDAALPRGLWDIHIKDAPGLRTFMREWVFNMGGKFIKPDMEKVLRGVIVDDDWKTMDKIIPVFDKRFAQWVKR